MFTSEAWVVSLPATQITTVERATLKRNVIALPASIALINAVCFVESTGFGEQTRRGAGKMVRLR